MSLLQTVTQSAVEKKIEQPKEPTGFCAGATVRLKERSGSPRDNTRIKEVLTVVDRVVMLEEPLDGSTFWNISDLEVMVADGIFEGAKPSPTDSIYVVFVPANVYTGRYHSFSVARVKVLASSKEEATEIVNKNQADVLRFLSTRRVQPSGRPLIPAKEPAKKNVFFKDSYYIKELPSRSSNDVMTRHGGFKAVRLDKMNEALINSKATPGEAAGYLYTLLKNTKEGRRATWEHPSSESPKVAEFHVRYFGDWEVPEGEEDDGDYDWKVPTPFTIKQIDDAIKTAGQRYPDFKVDVSVEEKEWIAFKVTARS